MKLKDRDTDTDIKRFYSCKSIVWYNEELQD